MSATAWPPSSVRARWPEAAWLAFAAGNVVAMLEWESWETIPFHFIWVSLTIVYGLRIWADAPTLGVLGGVVVVTGGLILRDVSHGTQEWGELTEVPLMSTMFLAMMWHARRRQQALRIAEGLADERARLLEGQESFLHDVSHELRTPVTIARGHLELLARLEGPSAEVDVALDELGRVERIVERLLLLARSDRPDFIAAEAIAVEDFLADVFVRWSGAVPRVWRLGSVPDGVLHADPDAIRIALDALLENAVQHTGDGDGIELSAAAEGRTLSIEVADTGPGVPADALERIFDRFARADEARTRSRGGVGLGLSIVAAIAGRHGGGCRVANGEAGARFTLVLPGFAAEPAGAPDYAARR